MESNNTELVGFEGTNWNKPEGWEILYTSTCCPPASIFEQCNSDELIQFYGWSDLSALKDTDTSDTVALWMPKGLKQRSVEWLEPAQDEYDGWQYEPTGNDHP